MFKAMNFLGEGRNRIVFRYNEKYVLKIPSNEEGLFDNEREAKISNKYGRAVDVDEIRYARCKLLSNGWLLMEYVNTSLSSKDLPEWSSYIDCWQVGKTVNGDFAAYDYAEL